jgi:hypothetical protein
MRLGDGQSVTVAGRIQLNLDPSLIVEQGPARDIRMPPVLAGARENYEHVQK